MDEFVHKHFSPVGAKMTSKRWNMQVATTARLTDTVKLIVHCEGFCSHAPAEVQEEARRQLMAQGGDVPTVY